MNEALLRVAMINTSSVNISPNLSSVQSADNSHRQTQDSSYVKLPVPAIDFRQQIIRSSEPVDEVTIEGAAQIDLGTVSSDKSRVELREGQSTLPRTSRPASQPPVAEAISDFPSIDVSSEPNLGSDVTEGPSPLDLAKSLRSELKVGRTNTESTDQLELSSEAKVSEVQARYSANSSVERLEEAQTERREQITEQSFDRSEQATAEKAGQGGQQKFDHLV